MPPKRKSSVPPSGEKRQSSGRRKISAKRAAGDTALPQQPPKVRNPSPRPSSEEPPAWTVGLPPSLPLDSVGDDEHTEQLATEGNMLKKEEGEAFGWPPKWSEKHANVRI